jgi:hypothetical protein
MLAPILPHHVRIGWPSSSSPMLPQPLLGTDGLSFPFFGEPGLPSPPSLTLTPFPSDHRQWPISMSGTPTVSDRVADVVMSSM